MRRPWLSSSSFLPSSSVPYANAVSLFAYPAGAEHFIWRRMSRLSSHGGALMRHARRSHCLTGWQITGAPGWTPRNLTPSGEPVQVAGLRRKSCVCTAVSAVTNTTDGVVLLSTLTPYVLALIYLRHTRQGPRSPTAAVYCPVARGCGWPSRSLWPSSTGSPLDELNSTTLIQLGSRFMFESIYEKARYLMDS